MGRTHTSSRLLVEGSRLLQLVCGTPAKCLRRGGAGRCCCCCCRRFGDGLAWYVPLGLKSWFRWRGITNVTELDWWQEVQHPGSKVTLWQLLAFSTMPPWPLVYLSCLMMPAYSCPV